MNVFTVKIMATVAACCLIASVAWDVHISGDREARTYALSVRCNTAYVQNERIAQVQAACSRDSVLKRYDDISVLLVVGLISAGMGAVVGFASMSNGRRRAQEEVSPR
jgi:sorbitol-specific phosphotransferase system component IIBC